ncbi:MAG: GtrA family protein [Sphingomonadaceae bacterium]
MIAGSFSVDHLRELWRYYQAGIINTVFGIALYSLLVWLGLDMFVAQLVAHLLGMAFNYFTYSRHVFRDAGPSKLRFVVSYAFNYLLNLGTLWLLSRFIASPYIAGILTAFLVSIVNYFALKLLVFRPGRT